MQKQTFDKNLSDNILQKSSFNNIFPFNIVNDSFETNILHKINFRNSFLSKTFQKHKELENNIFQNNIFNKSFYNNNLQKNK